jgi:MerR family transcriptional regulator, light-induced transcriptional regulator
MDGGFDCRIGDSARDERVGSEVGVSARVHGMSGHRREEPRRSDPDREPVTRTTDSRVDVVPPNDIDGLPISEVSRLLAVPVPTLRSWELRYGIPDTARSVGNHRRYFPEQLHALRLMRDEIVRGKRASAAARSVRAVLGMTGPASELVEEFLSRSSAGDPAGIREVMSRAERMLGLAGCIDDVLMPGMRQVGLWWATGHCDVDEERLTTESVRAWLNDLTAVAPSPNHHGPVLLASGPSDLHTLGIEALATMLRHRRWNCRVLGARVPADALVTSARGSGAVAVVVVSHLASGRLRAVESIRRCDRAGLRVFYAGNAFGSTKSRAAVPGSYLGTRLGEACELIEHSLAAGQTTARFVSSS